MHMNTFSVMVAIEQNVKDALAEGKIKISDLDWLGIQYHKDPIE